ncbi:MAG TPA: CPBP family intramembrane glutamic endopeptidase [Candidatus Limnocylindrales bacterium]|nr:CPBP family intramembrane glutamic endopeptidase [Candidatus Limnocylindrales bacterium]
MRILLTFFLLTYAVTWTCWGAATALPRAAPAPLRGLIIILGVFAPALVAVSLTSSSGGLSGVLALLRRLVQWRVGVRWYFFAAGYMAAIKLMVALAHRVLAGAWPRFGHEAWYVMIAATVFSTVVGGQAGEELGWRGFALPRLAARFGLGRASLLLGVIWACWHLPLFWLFPDADTFHQSFPVYLLQVTALSVAIAWLYGKTNGSLLLTMLMHSAINNTRDIVPSAVTGATHPFALSTSLVAWLTLALLWITAAYFLARMPALAEAANQVR